jgi:hypothetical protein
LQITPVPLLGDRSQIRNGDSVFSFGCDRGADPSRIDTRITGIDKYNQHLELSNIEIAGAPIDGRSGGGLFNARGQLIGVCNAADYNDNIGIYAGPGEVAWQLQRVNLTQLLDSSPVAAPGGGQFAAANTSSAAAGPSSDPTAAPMPINPPNNPPNNPSTNPSAGQQPTAPALATGGAGNGEVIIFYRDPNRPDAAPRVKVFSQPPAELLRFVQ